MAFHSSSILSLTTCNCLAVRSLTDPKFIIVAPKSVVLSDSHPSTGADPAPSQCLGHGAEDLCRQDLHPPLGKYASRWERTNPEAGPTSSLRWILRRTICHVVHKLSGRILCRQRKPGPGEDICWWTASSGLWDKLGQSREALYVVVGTNSMTPLPE